MHISSIELQAFRMVSTVLNFSTAAERIHITQSALSQRIQNLERKLGLTLFIRDRKAIKLTEAGVRLLRYCQAKDHLESELLCDLIETSNGKLGGYLRIAAYSSILHSVIMPALAPLLRENPAIQFELTMHEMDELPQVLIRGEADFVIMDHKHEKNNLSTELLGYEKYLLIQSNRYPITNIYLDHDPNDKSTQLFFKQQGKNNDAMIRCYVDDINGILNGVILGLGQGVLPQHLIKKELPIQIVRNTKPMKLPLFLHYFNQPYYSNLQKITLSTLKKNCKKYL